MTVLEGGGVSTSLPNSCCDAIFLRDVFSGRLAIIDFVPEPGSELPDGVPATRGGHGIRPDLVIEELRAAGFTHIRTIPVWSPEGTKGGPFLVLFARLP